MTLAAEGHFAVVDRATLEQLPRRSSPLEGGSLDDADDQVARPAVGRDPMDPRTSITGCTVSDKLDPRKDAVLCRDRLSLLLGSSVGAAGAHATRWSSMLPKPCAT